MPYPPPPLQWLCWAHLAPMGLVIQETEPWGRLQRRDLLLVNEIPDRCSVYLGAAGKVGVNSTIKYVCEPFPQHTARTVHYTQLPEGPAVTFLRTSLHMLAKSVSSTTWVVGNAEISWTRQRLRERKETRAQVHSLPCNKLYVIT